MRTWVLLIGAGLLFAAGVLNFIQRWQQNAPPTDGVVWAQTRNGILAESVDPASAAARAGILTGDRLISISLDERQFDEVDQNWKVQIYLEQAGTGGHLVYLIERPSYPEETRYYYADLYNLEPIVTWKSRDFYLNAVGLVYLLVGLFVLFKQGVRAPYVTHFVTLCLAAFVFHFFKPTRAFEDIDLAIAFLNDAAFILFAPLFVHFCLLYPARPQLSNGKRWLVGLVYVPAIVLLLLATINYFAAESLVQKLGLSQLIDGLNRAAFIHFTAALVLGAAFLVARFMTSKVAVVRQQLKWVVWGSTLAIAPFTMLYGVGYISGQTTPEWLADVAVLPLILIPLAFGNSVVRYRLMDVDMVVRRVSVYALSTLAIALMIGAVVYVAGLYALGEALTPGEITLRVIIAVLAMAIIVMIAGPIKNSLQEWVDRLFYGEQYDLRQGLLDFGRTISATTALEPLLDALVNRLQQVLDVEKVAIFIEDSEAASGYRVARDVGLRYPASIPTDFREMIRSGSAQTGVVRADDLDLLSESSNFVRQPLHYYVPCVVRGRMVAVIGLGRSADGALLSTEDIEILRTISGYIAVAIENSLLYQEQEARTKELELLKEFNESIVESINVGLLAVSLDGRVTACNSSLEEILDVRRSDVISRYVEDLFADDFAETLSQVLGADRWSLTELRRIYKLHTATKSGRSLVLNIAMAPLRAETSGRTGAIVVLEDVTSRVHLEEQLQQREKLSSIGLLAAGIAHEVNTPLTGVSSYTQMLLNMLSENDPKHALLQKIRRQTDRASNIVNNLLNFSRTGTAAEFNPLDVHRILDDTLQLLEPQLRSSQIEVVRAYDAEVPKVFGNAGKLQQVFTNLLINARDASPGGGNVTLKTYADNGTVVIEVADTGIGIAPENVAKIYDPFYTTKGIARGTGLGLAVSYGIVQEHSGQITVSSTPGHGTTFKISLPSDSVRTRLQAASD